MQEINTIAEDRPQSKEVFLRVPRPLWERIAAEMEAKEHRTPQALILAALERQFTASPEMQTRQEAA